MTAQPQAAHVLIVEDNDAHARLAAKVLESAGYTCAHAASAEQALQLIAAGAPDLVLMDLMLPGMSGLEAIAKLRAENATRAPRIIAVTSHRHGFLEADVSRAGADGLIAKPYHYAHLIELARAVLARSRRAH